MQTAKHPCTVVASGLRFPEGPIALADGSVLLVEIAAGRLTRIHPDGHTETAATPGAGPNGAAIGADGACYVCNNGGFGWRDENGELVPDGRPAEYAGGRLERIDPETGQVQCLIDRTATAPLSGPNDLVVDAEGGIWFTDLGHIGLHEIQRGSVCYLPAGSTLAKTVVAPMLTPNGIGLSPDGKTLYVAETITARVWAFDVCAPGELDIGDFATRSLRPGRLLYASDCDCNFDSLAVEADGNICVATIGVAGKEAPGGAGITVISPSGELVERVYLPDRGTTNLCFGGKDMRTAYITQSRTGKLLAMHWPRRGLALNFSR